MAPELTFIHYWTDSPTSQYRNKTIFSIVANHEAEFGVPANWNYFEAGHGKGPCDGVGGSAKRMANEAVKRQKATIQDASNVFAWASQTSTSSAVKYIFYSKDDYTKAEEKIARFYSDIRTVPGTLKVHAVAAINREQVCTRATSCYCDTCLKKIQGSATPVESCEWTKFTIRDPNTTSVNEQLSIAVGEWIASKYDKKWFIGTIKEVDKEDGEACVKFMTRGRGKTARANFMWPEREDILWVKREDILCVIEPPLQTSKTRQTFQLSVATIDLIEERFREATRKV